MLNQTKKLSKRTIATLIAGVVIIALLIVATTTSDVVNTFWAMLPPIIAI